MLLVHTRLAIIDPGPSGAQPMATPDGRHRIVFNGEVYNYRELRRSLEARGERFTTGSDTEVLLRLLACDGPGALAQVRGMFALAWWDAEARALVARARSLRHQAAVRRGDRPVDRVRVGDSRAGRRPAWSSARSIRPACSAYLAWGTRAAVADLRRRRREPGAGHRGCAGSQDGRLRAAAVRGRRRASTRGRIRGCTESELRARVGAAVQDSVAAHLVADVPVGVFLSGGIDSSAILSAAVDAGATGLNTYTVRFDDRSSEHEYARLVASTFGATHHELVLDPSRIVGDLPRILARLDQPTLDAVNSYYVSAAVAETGIKAVLSGTGRRRAVRRLSVVPPPAGGDALEAAAAAAGSRRWRRSSRRCCRSV